MPSSILASLLFLSGEAGNDSQCDSRGLRKVAASMELLLAKGADLGFPDELVPPLIVDAFTDDGMLESLGRNGRKEDADKDRWTDRDVLKQQCHYRIGGLGRVANAQWHRDGLDFSLST
jgi:hypothetical protein